MSKKLTKKTNFFGLTEKQRQDVVESAVDKSMEDQLEILKKAIREQILDEYKQNPPIAMGVSQWREYGKRMGYWEYFLQDIFSSESKARDSFEDYIREDEAKKWKGAVKNYCSEHPTDDKL